MGKPLLSLCTVPPIADRDGNAGATARFYLPFYGYWNVSGQVLTFPNALVYQSHDMRLGGSSMPNTFQKDCCSCAAGGENLIMDYEA